MPTGDQLGLLAHLTRFVSPRRRRRIEAVLAERTRLLTVVLEDVYQPHNASAVLRSCECFGVQDVHAVESTNPYEINDDIALGAAKWLTIRRHQDLGSCLSVLRAQAFRLVATTPHRADCTLDQLRVVGPTAFLLGTEEAGLSPEALAAADVRVRLPIFGFTESFNVSVCAALVLHDAVCKLRASGAAWKLPPTAAQALRLTWYRRSIRSVELIEERFRQEKLGRDPTQPR
jgi:tRNA (guanosine-2'-O-)-methyltransferase